MKRPILVPIFLSLALFCTFWGCSEESNNIVASKIENQGTSLRKPDFTQYSFNSNNFINSLTPTAGGYHGQEGYYVLGTQAENYDTTNYYNTKALTLILWNHNNGTNNYGCAEMSFDNSLYHNENLKYYSFGGTLNFDMDTKDNLSQAQIRAAVWLYSTSGDVCDPNSTLQNSIGMEIFTSKAPGHDYEICFAYSERTIPGTFTADYNDNYTTYFNRDSANSYFKNNLEYRIDWYPTYIEFWIGGKCRKRFEHSMASPKYMIPWVSYYYLSDNPTVLSTKFSMHVTNPFVHQLHVNKTLNINSIKFGSLNHKLKRYGLDTVNGDGINDSYYSIPLLTSEEKILYGNFCSTHAGSEIGVYRPSDREFFLDSDGNGNPYDQGSMTFGQGGDIPIVGDWNGDGIATPGIYRPSTGYFYLTNSVTNTWHTDYCIHFGNSGDVPIVGNWDGVNGDDIGVYKSDGLFQLSISKELNNTITGTIYKQVYYGIGNGGDIPISGNWDQASDNKDKVGVYRIADKHIWLTRDFINGYPYGTSIDLDGEGDVPIIWKP